MIPSEAEKKLMCWMHGWRHGAKGAVLAEPLLLNEDTKAGFEAGRTAAQAAYAAACEKYQARLSILRGGEAKAEPEKKPLLCRMAALIREFYQSALQFRAQGNDEGMICMESAAARLKEECDSYINDFGFVTSKQHFQQLTKESDG